MSRPLVRLSRASIAFPPVEHALTEPNGLLAIGGDLRPERLLNAYSHGIFPWFDDDSPLLWWSPDPRAVLCPDGVRIHRSLRQTLRRARFMVTFDTAFTAVVEGCRAPRDGAAGTWITAAMVDAYAELHRRGIAHSVEAWQAGELVGGLYGVALGGAFFGESMFHRATDASKVALVHLAGQLQAWEFDLIDCQVLNAHTASLGAREVPRREFLARLDQALRKPHRPGPWSLSFHWTPEAARAG